MHARVTKASVAQFARGAVAALASAWQGSARTCLALCAGMLLSASELSTAQLDAVRDQLMQALGPGWDVKSETRYDASGQYTNERGRMVEAMIKPGLDKMSGIGAADISIGSQEKFSSRIIIVRLLEFSSAETATAFFRQKYQEDKSFAMEDTGICVSATSGKLAYRHSSVTISVSSAPINAENARVVRQAMASLRAFWERTPTPAQPAPVQPVAPAQPTQPAVPAE